MTPVPTHVPLDEKLATVARAERLARAQVLVKNYTLTSAAIALLPFPLVDQVALMALVVKMVHGLARHYDVPFKANVVRALIASLLSGLTGGLLIKGFYSLSKAVPLLGALGGGGGIALSSASITYALGAVFIKHFEAKGSLLNIDSEWFKKMFNEELKQEPVKEDAEPPAEATTVTAAVVG
ncbi:MAG: DUF697 domain-containing protein [Cyanobacteriota bacterium]|jgi:uncharacterized protein (DUF697 family)